MIVGAAEVFRSAIRLAVPRNWPFGLPIGSFSDIESLKRDNTTLEGEIILEDQGKPTIPEHSIMILCNRFQHSQQPWPLFWSRHRNARLVGPSLALMDNQRRLQIESVYGDHYISTDPSYHEFVTKQSASLSGPWTSIVSRWNSNDSPQPYGHWLLDALPRLAFLDRFPENTRILIPPLCPLYQTDSLQLLGANSTVSPDSRAQSDSGRLLF